MCYRKSNGPYCQHAPVLQRGFEKGDETIYEGDEFMGRVLQHELDHLKGKLLLKSMTRKQRKEALKEISIKGFPGDKI